MDQKNNRTTITTLKKAVEQGTLEPADIPAPATPIQRLCQAWFTNGIYISVPAGVTEETVLQPIYREFATPRIDLIIADIGHRAEATIVEGCTAPRSTRTGFRAGYTLIMAGESADITHCNLQNWRQTRILDTTRHTAPGTVSSDHFIDASGIVEASTSSRLLTPLGTAHHPDGFRGSFPAAPPGEPAVDALQHLPDEYRNELQHILDTQ